MSVQGRLLVFVSMRLIEAGKRKQEVNTGELVSYSVDVDHYTVEGATIECVLVGFSLENNAEVNQSASRCNALMLTKVSLCFPLFTNRPKRSPAPCTVHVSSIVQLWIDIYNTGIPACMCVCVASRPFHACGECS